MIGASNRRPLRTLFYTLLVLISTAYLSDLAYLWHVTINDTRNNLKYINSILARSVSTTLKLFRAFF